MVTDEHAFPKSFQHFRMDRKRTWGDVVDDNPDDWAWYVRADLYQELEAKLAAAEAKLQGVSDAK